MKARWFSTSSISSLHYHVDIDHNDRWIPVLETGSKIDRVYIDQDTVVVQLPPKRFLLLSGCCGKLPGYLYNSLFQLDIS